MTDAEAISNGIAGLSLVVAAGSAAIAGLALRRTAAAEKREREAIVAIRNVWSGTPGLDDMIIPGVRGRQTQFIRHNPQPAKPEKRLVIAMESSGHAGVLTRQSDKDVVLVLRTATAADLAVQDGPGGRNTHYALLEIRNVGRWAATNVQLVCTLTAPFARDFEEGTDDRDFPGQVISFEALAPNEPRYVQVRNMTGLPVMFDFDDVSAGNDQPIRLAPATTVTFEPMGYRS
jgi:hypothetical protein